MARPQVARNDAACRRPGGSLTNGMDRIQGFGGVDLGDPHRADLGGHPAADLGGESGTGRESGISRMRALITPVSVGRNR